MRMNAATKGKSTKSTSAVKNEKRVPDPAPDEGEYDEWARTLVNRPIPQVGLSLAGVLGSAPGIDGVLPSHQGFDVDSAIGRFTWHTVPGTDKSVPCIFRSGEAFCCVRMVETAVIGDLLHALPQDVYDAAKLNSHFITAAEAKLLSYISTWHCDGAFGVEQFTTDDLVVNIPEMETFHHYLQFAYEVLSSGGGNKNEDYTRCGFVRVNNESLIPYTVLSETEMGVPLFYFEGQTDILKEKATPLQGWELAYLKICCKVQGVRKDLISNESLLIVKLTDLKGYFPKRTVFTDKCWPPAKSKSLISKSMLTARAGHTGGRSSIVTNNSNHTNQIQNRWLAQSDNSNILRAGNGANSIMNRLMGQTLNSASASATTINTANPSVLAAARSVPKFNGYNGSYSNGYQQVQQVQAHNQPRNGQVSGQNQNIQLVTRNQVVASKPTNLHKLKVTAAPVSMLGLNILADYPDGYRDGSYNVRMIMIETELVHCINSEPNKDIHLLVLQGFINQFFPGVTIYPTAVSVLKSIGITTYLPNNAQIRVFNNAGFGINRAWEMPLIPAKEAIQLMPRIKLLLTPKPAQARLNPAQDMSRNANPGLPNGFYYQAGQAR